MRKVLTMLIAATAIGTTLVATSGTADARWGYGWGGGWRGSWRYAGGRHGGWGYRGGGWGYRGWGYPGLGGFAAGAVIGSAIAAAPYTSFPSAYYVGYGQYPYAYPPVYSGYGYGYGYGCGC